VTPGVRRDEQRHSAKAGCDTDTGECCHPVAAEQHLHDPEQKRGGPQVSGDERNVPDGIEPGRPEGRRQLVPGKTSRPRSHSASPHIVRPPPRCTSTSVTSSRSRCTANNSRAAWCRNSRSPCLDTGHVCYLSFPQYVEWSRNYGSRKGSLRWVARLLHWIRPA